MLELVFAQLCILNIVYQLNLCLSVCPSVRFRLRGFFIHNTSPKGKFVILKMLQHLIYTNRIVELSKPLLPLNTFQCSMLKCSACFLALCLGLSLCEIFQRKSLVELSCGRVLSFNLLERVCNIIFETSGNYIASQVFVLSYNLGRRLICI